MAAKLQKRKKRKRKLAFRCESSTASTLAEAKVKSLIDSADQNHSGQEIVDTRVVLAPKNPLNVTEPRSFFGRGRKDVLMTRRLDAVQLQKPRPQLVGGGVVRFMAELVLISVLTSLRVNADTTVTFYLHGTGSTDNPATIFLDNAAPTGTSPKFKDSAGVNFAGGNLWKEIGSWNSTATTPQMLLSAIDARLWLGLKNSDDQGTQFDVRAEVYRNQVLMTAGQTLCIAGITRNPDQAKEVSIQLGTFSGQLLIPTDGLVLKVLARIGTNADGTKCSGPGGSHSSAVGLRLYFDAVNRPSAANFVRADTTLTGSMKEGRLEFTATRLNNGTVLVTGGGTTGYPIAISTAEIYDPTAGTWRYTLFPMNFPRRLHTATKLLDGRVLVVGGIGTSPGPGDPSPLSADVFDPSTERFIPTGPMVQGFAAHRAVLLADGRVLVTGLGTTDTTSEIYNPVTNAWTPAAALPVVTYYHDAVVLPDGTVLVSGGIAGAGVYAYNMGTDTWRSMTPLLIPRSKHSMTLLPDGRVLIVGGSSQLPNSSELYDPSALPNGQTSFGPALADDRGIGTHTATLLLNGDILIAGGQSSGSGTPFLATMQVFQHATQSWSPVSLMTTTRAEHSAALLQDGSVLLTGGWSSTGQLQSAELWRP